MNEREIRKILRNKIAVRLKRSNPDCEVVDSESLLYNIQLGLDLQLQPELEKIYKPRRANYAFETDLLIKKNEVPETPLVVIELKRDGFNTGDIITYSSKAVRHKDIYPYIRYGFVVVNKKRLDKKFFTHNVGIDFAMVIEDLKKLGPFFEILDGQIESAKKNLKIMDKKTHITAYVQEVTIK